MVILPALRSGSRALPFKGIHTYFSTRLVSYHSLHFMMPFTTNLLQPCSNFKRNFATSERETEANRFVTFLNTSITKYPQETIVSLIATEIISIYGIHEILVFYGVKVSPEFAIAFGISRLLRRVRLPIEIGTAAVFAYYFPSLTRVKVTALSEALPSSIRSEFNRGSLKRGAERIGQIVDKYGAAYFLAARWVGVSVVLSVHAGLLTGIDVAAMAEPYFGSLGSSAGNILGTWAAAVVISSTLYPFTILGAGGLARVVGILRKRVS